MQCLFTFFVGSWRQHCKPIPVLKTGFSLCTFSHREKPVCISWDPCNENRIFPVGKKYTGKSLFWPCTDIVRDCSVCVHILHTHIRGSSFLPVEIKIRRMKININYKNFDFGFEPQTLDFKVHLHLQPKIKPYVFLILTKTLVCTCQII